MEAFIIAYHMEGPVHLEVTAEVDSAQLQHCFGHLRHSAPPRTLQPGLDEILTSPFDYAGGIGSTLLEILVVAHMAAIVVEVARCRIHDLAPLSQEVALRPLRRIPRTPH
jgi:hypothetical protein